MPSGPSARPIHIDDKITAQLTLRGWTEQQIRETVASPAIGTSTDNTRVGPILQRFTAHDLAAMGSSTIEHAASFKSAIGQTRDGFQTAE
jgi:hypothetical protein